MATPTESLDILEKMLLQQRFAKQILGSNYDERVAQYMKYVNVVMERDSCNEIVAVMKICEDKEVSESALTIALLMSAAIEISKL